MADISKIIIDNLTHLIDLYGLWAVLILMTAESALIPIPSEVTMCFAGFLAGRGVLNFFSIVFVGALGNLIGSLLAYWLGAVKGESWVRMAIDKWGKWLLIREKDYDKAKSWFQKYGQMVAFGSRLLPVVRTFISLPAGITKMNLPLFCLLTFSGSLIWSAFLAWLGVKFGQNWLVVEPYFRKFQFVIIGLGILAVIFYIRTHLKHKKT